MPFHHQIRVRYSECDQQGVVFNAHYVAYMDDATEVWVRSVSPDGDEQKLGWEWMVVHVGVDWVSSARTGEILDIDVAIVSWGTSSFHFGFIGKVGDRLVFRGRSICVTVDKSTFQKMPTPVHIRQLMGDAVDWDVPV
jgi:acyl-CoA thioester hydrolase